MNNEQNKPVSAAAVTQMLQAWPDTDSIVLDQLMPAVYQEIHSIAKRLFIQEPAGHTWQATALSNEFYLALSGGMNIEWVNREQFFAFAAKKMRRLLINKAQQRRAAKRGGGQRPLRVTNLGYFDPQIQIDLLALEAALKRLQTEDEISVNIVELRFYAGLSVPEVAQTLGIDKRTVFRRWAWIKAWLYHELSDGDKHQ